jgi:CxxC-x17-CxxC domain-containing protein
MKRSKRTSGPVDYSRYSDLNKEFFSSNKKEMYKVKCQKCGKECEVPFKPASGRPVFCRDCYKKKNE